MTASWENSQEVASRLSTYSDAEYANVMALYAVHRLLLGSVMGPRFDGIDGLADALPVSAYGTKLIDTLDLASSTSSDQHSTLALFCFFHRDLLIDLPKLNIEGVFKCVEGAYSAGKLRLPQRYGRDLYDRFNAAQWGERLEFIDYDKVETLLADDPQGFYQIGHLTFGPLGFVVSNEARFSPPSRSIPLWHCSDVGCGAIHLVELKNAKSVMHSFIDSASETFKRRLGDASDWQTAFFGLIKPTRREEYVDLLSFLYEAFDDVERDILFEYLLEGENAKDIRSLVADRKGKKASAGTAENIKDRLSINEKMQLLLTRSTSELVAASDFCISTRAIVIPESEIRSSQTPVFKRSGDLLSSASSLGLRTDRPTPPLFLSDLIYSAYDEFGLLADLAWRCGVDNVNVSDVFRYIGDNGPQEAVKSLVLSTRNVFESCLNQLHLYQTLVDDDLIVDKILWKCGFHLARYNDFITLFRNALANLKDRLLSAPSKLNDSDREVIRSAGVNAFVYCENFIEQLITFNVWLFVSDHMGPPAPIYWQQKAYPFVSILVLPESNPEIPPWSLNGGNTLGPLLFYARRMVTWIQNFGSLPKDAVVRQFEQYPHFSDENDDNFPFKHISLWADIAPDYAASYATIVNSIVELLEQSRSAELRNGLQHYREAARFPTVEALLACEARLSNSLDMADNARIIPKTFWLKTRTVNEAGITHCILEDYRGRKVDVALPYTLSGIASPSFDQAFILPAGGMFGDNAPNVIAQLREQSHFVERWATFSNRKP